MFRRLFQILSPMHSRNFCSNVSILTVKEILETKPINQKIVVRGWVQALRKHKDTCFVDLIDGTRHERLQVLIDTKNNSKMPAYGSSIKVEGHVVKSSHKGQELEMIADSWLMFGECGEDYPLYNRIKFSPEYIRQNPHLRPRTRTFSSVLRIRDKAFISMHKFFQEEGFCFVHTPIITKNDCEGGGEVFSVGIKDKDQKPTSKKVETPDTNIIGSNNSSKDELPTITQCLPNEDEEFFGSSSYLTVSGQLHLEAIAHSIERVYTFGPTFRAEKSHSRLHASEFQMIEAEIAFIETESDLITIVEKCIKNVTESLLVSNCIEDVKFITKDVKNHEEYLERYLSKPFIKMSYDEAINILKQNQKKLKVPVKLGEDLGNDHKQFLVKYCNNIPVFVCMFPSSIKPFYMKSDKNDKAHCFDLFAPYGGEICGGSLREDNEEILKKKYLFQENYNLLWYLDLRKYGSVPHGGFGIGFDRFLQSILRISNIQDVIPFPRRKSNFVC